MANNTRKLRVESDSTTGKYKQNVDVSSEGSSSGNVENKSLSEMSRFVNAYRDQLDVLKIKAEKANKLENEILKYKERLTKMDVLKKRKEELEEQNKTLYNAKVVLDTQINILNSKADKLVETRREVERLKKDLKDVIEEKRALQTRNKYLLDENAVLLLNAKNRLEEVSAERQKCKATLRQKSREIIELASRKIITDYQTRVHEANTELAETLESQRDEITSQEKRVAEVMSFAKEEKRKYSETIREKDRRVKELGRWFRSELIVIGSKLEKLKDQLKQNDRKST